MTLSARPPDRPPLRLWPGVALVAFQWTSWHVVPFLFPAARLYAVLGALAAGPLLVLWWLFFSRAPWSERLSAIAWMALVVAVTPPLLDESVARGNLGFQYYLYVIPALSLALVLWAALSRRLSTVGRMASLAAAMLLAGGCWTLVRSRGLTGDGAAQFTWRWAPTAEERLLAQEGPLRSSSAARVELPDTPIEWPGFRGADRAGVVQGRRLGTEWSSSPPVEIWRRPIGPGVSSFAVHGGLLYTQEQRGEDEVVVCYRVATGEPVWSHQDAHRFWDSHVGAGPRATPTLAGDRVYALGATGTLNALSAANGRLEWTRDVAADTAAKIPSFGLVSSPLVIDDLVIVYTNTLAAYDLATGEPRWRARPTGVSYSSPQWLRIDGVSQVLQVTEAGVISVSPADGSLLWDHAWPGIGILQPALADERSLLISQVDAGASPIGTRRLAVVQRTGGWTVDEQWTSHSLRPSFSQLVVHRGHAFGLDRRILTAIDLATGERSWKGGRYGDGQLLLLPDQDLLLVVTEQGELALVEATADRFHELARMPAIEGKTWSQPALVGDLLLVRNGQEMAAFRLPPAA